MHGTLSRSQQAGDAADAARGRTASPWPLACDPFLNRPSPDLFFPAGPHRAAWNFLRQSLRRRVPFVLLTGEFGAGKTMLSLRLVRAIQERELGRCVHMSTPAQRAAAVLRRTAEAAGLDPADLPQDAAGLAQALHARLSDDPPEHRLFMVLEDPQDLDPDALAHLLHAVPTARTGQAALTAVLIGHSSLPQLLQRARFRRVDGRIRKRHHLAAMNAEETRAYIAFRLSQAAGDDAASCLPAFDDAALHRVFELTRGNPREINNVCGISLNQAVTRQRGTIDRDLVDQAARALGRPVPPVPSGAAPVVVPFPGAASAGGSPRGCPDYVRQAPPRAADPTPAQTQPTHAGPAAGAPVGATRSSQPAASSWRHDRRVQAAAAGAALLLAAAYLAAPYLTPERLDGAAGTAREAAPAALSPSERREVEALLRNLEFETGPVDGTIDPKTQGAVEAYKRMAGITPADGTVGRDLLADLRAITGSPPDQNAQATPERP